MTPVAEIEIASGDSATLNDRLVSVSLHDEAGHQNDRLTLVLDDRDPSIEFPPEGTEVRVSLGYESGGASLPVPSPLTEMGIFVITELEASGDEGGNLIKISANSLDTLSTAKQSRSRDYHNKKLGEIVTEVAERNEFEARIDPDLEEIEIPHIDQTNESDMAFVTRIGTRFGAAPKFVENRIMLFAKQGKTRSVGGADMPPVPLQRTDVTRFNYLKQGRGRQKKVRAKYYDKDKAEEMKAEVDSDQEVDSEFELAGTFATEEQAMDAVKGKARALETQKEVFSFDSIGLPGLLAEAVVNLIGEWKQGIPVVWKVISVDHTFTNSGYTTSCQCELTESGADLTINTTGDFFGGNTAIA